MLSGFQMHVRCGTKLKQTGELLFLGQPMLFECVGICVLSPAHEREMRGYLVYLLIVKYLSILFKYNHSILDWTALSLNWGWGWRVKKKIFGGVCRPYHLQGLYSESELIYLL